MPRHALQKRHLPRTAKAQVGVPPKPLKVLAFDGGPSPVISLRVLKKVEAQFPGFLDRVDLFAGTSHGGIISLKLATLLSNNVPAADAIDQCIEFDNEFLAMAGMTPTRVLRLLSGVLPVISNKSLVGFLEKHFCFEDGTPMRLGDLRMSVAVSAFDLGTGSLSTVSSLPFDTDDDITLLGAALACSSFPVIVSHFKPDHDAQPIIDGGFGANSGAMPALTEALRNLRAAHRGAHTIDLLPSITLLSMGCKSTDEALRIPLFEPFVQFAERLGLFGKEVGVKGGGVLRSAGWWYLVRSNVKMALTLLENTQSLDMLYASVLLDDVRYRRMAPELKLLEFLWLLLTDLDTALKKADGLAQDLWEKQARHYASWKADPTLQSDPGLPYQDELACWIDRYWMQDPAAQSSIHVPRQLSLDPQKRLSTFDASAQPKLPQRELAELSTCQFIKDARNVLIVGPSGSGKSHLAHAVGNEAVSRGHKVLYMPVARLLEQLEAARVAGTYDQKLAELTGVDLFILEDLWLKPMKDSGPGDLYDVVSECAGKRALVITSCIPLTEWGGRFGDPLLADAILTRLRTGRLELTLTGEGTSRADTQQEVTLLGRH